MTARLIRNQKRLAEQARDIQSQVQTIAIVKNDAYNFGLKDTFDAFYHGGIRAFATTNLKEAKRLRSYDQNVLVLLLDPSTAFDELRQHDITLSVPSFEFYSTYRDELEGLSVQLVFRNDLNRLGFTSSKDMLTVLEDDQLDVNGIWTHFAYADDFETDRHTNEVANWRAMLKDLNDHLSNLTYIHAQNSASFLRDGLHEGHTHIRGGVILYGTRPYYQGLDEAIARQTVEVTANVIEITDVPAGQNAGYSAAFTADKPTRLAVCDIGYGNGLILSRRDFPVLINDQSYPIRVMMMSHLLVEIDESVSVGDKVVLYNDQLRFDWFTEHGAGSFSQQMAAFNKETFVEEFIPY
ncbi:alanine racemase [Alkalibacterium indicireducens]|uniref:Alanine racemase n=1 Tax=Alkalibacterium indicireducens TaxID=398758 RepID=A0ABN1BBN3_9LACT